MDGPRRCPRCHSRTSRTVVVGVGLLLAALLTMGWLPAGADADKGAAKVQATSHKADDLASKTSELAVKEHTDDTAGVDDGGAAGGAGGPGRDEEPDAIPDDVDAQISQLDAAMGQSSAKIKAEQADLAHKVDILKRVHLLRAALATKAHDIKTHKYRESAALLDLDVARERRDSAAYEVQFNAQLKEEEGEKLDSLRKELPQYHERLGQLKEVATENGQMAQTLERNITELTEQYVALVVKFKDRGMTNWVEMQAQQLPPLLQGTLLKTTHALGPLFEGFEEASNLNARVVDEVKERVQGYLPLVQSSPFYGGILFYVIILFPMVLFVSAAMKLNSRLKTMTISHYLVLSNLYFGVLSVLCLFMSYLSGADVLLVFHHRNESLEGTFVVVHGFFYVVHLGLHFLSAVTRRDGREVAQFLSMFIVGTHYFLHVYARAVLNEDPVMDLRAYVLYAAIFLFTLYVRVTMLLPSKSGRRGQLLTPSSSMSGSNALLDNLAVGTSSTHEQ
ncbi:hypothetical protein BU14_1916s0001 [Porphyra umbilicalis]|uniref:Uncharacterized protein n=1 Tax=Porphyra umbilicalis TaxID=2786 RepID=A0A1X6NKC8_PORUM|nr:hypothetical protein BU14_1916s0001 [Porphyra umbilicalis]|eukprot:OSX69057.1 hypothetical protein BU14_1916s0001 [Porphyra umbilicalis]